MATASFASLARYIRTLSPVEPDSELLARFARGGDEAAFAELVRRHGPAVLGVCYRALGDAHAAEDAFQATFLLLARKAGSLRDPARLGCWLHGVAHRTALKLRARLARRQGREQPFDEAAYVPQALPDADLGPALDAAIEQLPRKYRQPVVLCYLQGLTNAEAAAALGCPANTIATRLARARQRLRGRLEKQGLTAAVSAALVAATARNAAALAAGASNIPPEVFTLMEGVRTAMMWKKLKLACAAVAVLTLTGFGASRFGFRAAADQPAAVAAPPAAAVPPPAAAVPVPTASAARPDDKSRIPPVDLATLDSATRNFIVTGAEPHIGHQIAQVAEWMRSSFAKEWLGKELPDWPKRCPIEVTINRGPAAASTAFEFGKEFRIGGMKLAGTREQVLMSLPREVMHTVLADHFRRPIPRWADEGVATLAEMRDSQRPYDRQCRQLLAAGRAMRLTYLFGLKDFPKDMERERAIERKLSTPVTVDFNNVKVSEAVEYLRQHLQLNIVMDRANEMKSEDFNPDAPVSLKVDSVPLKSVLNLLLKQAKMTYVIADDVLQVMSEKTARGTSAFTAQSHSVTRFLVERKDRATFLHFVGLGMTRDWETASRDAYGFRSVQELEEAWIAWLRLQPAPPSVRPIQYTSSPALPVAPPAVEPASAVAPPAPAGSLPPVTEMPPPVATPPARTTSPVQEQPIPKAPDPVPIPVLTPQVRPGPVFIPILASMDKDGMAVFRFPKLTYSEPFMTHSVRGKAQPVSSYIRRTVHEERLIPPESLQVYGADGKPVNTKEFVKRLAIETPVLLVEDWGFDPKLLTLLKEGTLIVCASPANPPEPAPPARR